MKKAIFIFASVFLVCFLIYNLFSSHSKASNISREDEYYYNEDNSLNKDGTIMTNSNSKGNNSKIHTESIDTVKDSYTVLVNKEYSLPADYIPEDLVVPDVLFNINFYDEKKLMRQVAATALEELFEAAKEEDLNFYAISGYRSYHRQKEIYDSNIATKGEEYTNRYSAKPGHSEHQTGLSMDVSTISVDNRLEPVFAYTPEGKWLAANAHRFGFIIRYPDSKEYITGYSYEPWHVRYVGKDLAKYLYKNNLTLEEYYNYEPTKVEVNEISYDNVIDIDTSTEKNEIKEPTEDEIEEASKDEDNKSEKDDTKKDDDKKDDLKVPSKENNGKNNNSSKDETVTDPVESIPDDTTPPVADPEEVEVPPVTDPEDNETLPNEDENGIPAEDQEPTEQPEIPITGDETLPLDENSTSNDLQ